jgi:plasmid stabilization system protein ParE
VDDELRAVFDRLAEQPAIGTRIRGGALRRLVLASTEYVVIYRIRPRVQRVEVLAFWHARRGPIPA